MLKRDWLIGRVQGFSFYVSLNVNPWILFYQRCVFPLVEAYMGNFRFIEWMLVIV
jgi:hypothetical protein